MEGDSWALAAFDEENAFSRVVTPAWLHLWCVCPPVPAYLVWWLLSDALRAACRPWTMVAPAYGRLAMGFSHAVAILMLINLTVVGRALIASRRRKVDVAQEYVLDANNQDGEYILNDVD